MSTSKNVGAYELLAVFAGSLKESEKAAALEKLEKELAKIGKVENKTVWADRPLAYKISKEMRGTYFVCHFTAEKAADIPELENSVRLNPLVIRHILVKLPKAYKWKDYTAEDLEADYKKVVTVFSDDEENAEAKPRAAGKPAAKKNVEPARKPAGKKPVAKKSEKPAPSAAELSSKLDSILDDLK